MRYYKDDCVKCGMPRYLDDRHRTMRHRCSPGAPRTRTIKVPVTVEIEVYPNGSFTFDTDHVRDAIRTAALRKDERLRRTWKPKT